MKYFKALVILFLYVAITRSIFFASVLIKNHYLAFALEVSTASIAGLAWMYFFDHENLFHFVKIVKDKKKDQVERLISKFVHFGSIIAIIIIGYIGGPLMTALPAHILMKNYKYRYLLVFLVSSSSSFVALAIARGILHLAFRLI